VIIDGVVSIADTAVRSPSFVWFSDESVSVVLGQNLTIECVAQGVPAPQIVWEKYGGSLPSGRHSVTLGSCHISYSLQFAWPVPLSRSLRGFQRLQIATELTAA